MGSPAGEQLGWRGRHGAPRGWSAQSTEAIRSSLTCHRRRAAAWSWAAAMVGAAGIGPNRAAGVVPHLGIGGEVHARARSTLGGDEHEATEHVDQPSEGALVDPQPEVRPAPCRDGRRWR